MSYFPGTAVAAHDLKLPGRGVPNSARFWMFFAVCAIGCALAVLKPIVGLGVIGAAVGICVLGYIFAATLRGEIEPMILTWVLLFPLGYYVLSFPREQSIITLDRVLPMVLLLAIALASRHKLEPLPRALRTCGIAWAVFLIFAAASLLSVSKVLQSAHLLVDGFCLPALLGWSILRIFDVERHAASLHIAVSVMAFYTMCIALAEEVVKEDLLPVPGSGIAFAGSIPRPNGPFGTNDSLALIGVITFFLLLFLWNVVGDHSSLWRRVVHWIGLTSSMAIALMPLFRAVGIALMVIILIATLASRRPGRRVAGFALLLLCGLAISLVSFLAPDVYEDRSDSGNIYGRLAQQVQVWYVFASHPILGVGLGSFHEAVYGETRDLAFYNGVQSLDRPHNTLGGILAETGILGFIPYVTAQITLFLAFWRFRKQSSRKAQLAWTYFLYIFLSYWIVGLTLQSGYASDINLWFIFSIALLYKYLMTEKVPSPELTELEFRNAVP